MPVKNPTLYIVPDQGVAGSHKNETDRISHQALTLVALAVRYRFQNS